MPHYNSPWGVGGGGWSLLEFYAKGMYGIVTGGNCSCTLRGNLLLQEKLQNIYTMQLTSQYCAHKK